MWADGEGMELDKQQVWWSGSRFDLRQNLGYRLSCETTTCNIEETVRQHEDVGRRGGDGTG